MAAPNFTRSSCSWSVPPNLASKWCTMVECCTGELQEAVSGSVFESWIWIWICIRTCICLYVYRYQYRGCNRGRGGSVVAAGCRREEEVLRWDFLSSSLYYGRKGRNRESRRKSKCRGRSREVSRCSCKGVSRMSSRSKGPFYSMVPRRRVVRVRVSLVGGEVTEEIRGQRAKLVLKSRAK